MVINFNKKIRRIIAFVSVAVIIAGGGVAYCLKENRQSIESFKIEDIENKNQYTMDVIFDDETKRLMCNQSIEYINNTGKDLDKIYFHIYPNAFSTEELAPFEKDEMKEAYPNGFDEGYIDIKNILQDSQKLQYKITGDKNDILEVSLNEELKTNEKILIDMKYNVKLPNSAGRFGYGDDTINLTNWFAIACVYDTEGWDLKSYEAIGDPFYSETSDFYVKLLFPSKYEIANTGKVLDKKSDGEKVMYEIEAKNVRDFAFILSDKFSVDKDSVKGIQINTYNLNENFSKLTTEVAKDSIKIFSDLFGQYPYEVYSVVASDFYIGGMEYPNLVMIDSSLYTENNKFLLEYVVAHETAHQWWYSVIGNNEISEPWIDEALTEYSTILYFEEKYGKETAERLLKTMKVQTRNYKSENAFKATTQYKNSMEYSLNVYTKGALIFNDIRNEIGDEAFFEALQEYYKTYMYKNVTKTNLIEIWKAKGIDFDKIMGE